jgi:hypothetical protein
MNKIILFVVTIFVACFSLWGNDGAGVYNPNIGLFSIQNSNAISMDDEIVNIYLDSVSVLFHFRNTTNKPQKVTIGFPILNFPSIQWSPGQIGTGITINNDNYRKYMNDVERYYNFKTKVNGILVDRKLVYSPYEKNIDEKVDTFWFVLELTFKPNEVIQIEDSYNYAPDLSHSSLGDKYETYTYILKTGATWSEPIGKTKIYFHESKKTKGDSFDFEYGRKSTTSESYSYEPTGIENENNTISWEMENWIPEKDLEISKSLTISSVGEYGVLAYLLGNSGYFTYNQSRAITYRSEKDGTIGSYDIQYLAKMSGEQYKNLINIIYLECFVDCNRKETNTEKSRELKKIVAKILRNSIYALHGYQFNDQKLYKYFSYFDWYKAIEKYDNNISNTEKEMINSLLLIEKTY